MAYKRYFFDFLNMKVCCVFSLESPHRGDSNGYTQHTIINITRMVVHGQLVEPVVCLSDLYYVFLLDIVRNTRQNLWTMIYRSQ